MVSTRGIKMKFYEGERVLCYEPDPTKAKVLYDSKVLDVVINKDNRGRKTVEYLIHFQGWNSSWDRCVSEEFVLKDTADNRQLQKDLAEKAQLQLGAYLYRKEKKKHSKAKIGDRTQSSEDGSSGSPAQLEMEDHYTSSEGDSSIEDDLVPIELAPDLLAILEHDHQCINDKNKLLKLPAEPTVVAVLESYWKYYATGLLYGLTEKPNTRNRIPAINSTKVKPEDLQKNLNLCKEMLDGLRIYFDFTLSDLLLYKNEKGQIETSQAKCSSIPALSTPNVKLESMEDNDLAPFSHGEYENGQTENDNVGHSQRPTRRSGLRSNRNLDSDHSETSVDPAKTASGSSNSEASGPFGKILGWRLLPENIYSQPVLPPSLTYGATHLLRLFVKLPELLHTSNMAENKLKVLFKQFDLFLEYLNEHKEWFGDKHYCENK